MAFRDLPVRPSLDRLEQEAQELLDAAGQGDPPADLDEARNALARMYRASDWARLEAAARLADAIWQDDLEVVTDLVTRYPALLHEEVLIRTDSNWGPPMSYAANLGRDRIMRMLHQRGAKDHRKAIGRAALQGKTGTVHMIHEWLGRPLPPDGSLGGPAYTLSVEGTAVLLELGGRVVDDSGNRLAPVSVVLETDSRNPTAKHAILALYEQRGLALPDTPTMALHRGRIDLLERHLAADPTLLSRTFSHREIYPAEMGCRDEIDATVGTPLGGTTLLHMAIDFDEFEIFGWLLDRGADPNVPSRVGSNGFGGYTPLFSTVVSQPNFWMNYGRRGPFVAPMTERLLERGADPNARASLWKRLHPGHGDPSRHEYRNVTPLSWGRRFHAPIFVSQPALALIEAAGGIE